MMGGHLDYLPRYSSVTLRWATIDGDGIYRWRPWLTLAVRDRRDLARALESMSYDAIRLIDAPPLYRHWWAIEVLRYRCRDCAANIGPVPHGRHRCPPGVAVESAIEREEDR